MQGFGSLALSFQFRYFGYESVASKTMTDRPRDRASQPQGSVCARAKENQACHEERTDRRSARRVRDGRAVAAQDSSSGSVDSCLAVPFAPMVEWRTRRVMDCGSSVEYGPGLMTIDELSLSHRPSRRTDFFSRHIPSMSSHQPGTHAHHRLATLALSLAYLAGRRL